jgi:topoisomerase-4 subunit A
VDEKGMYLGMFEGDDKILIIYRNGTYEITDQELTQRVDPDTVILIEKFDPSKIVTAIYYDGDKVQFNIKRFKIETQTLRVPFQFIKEGKENYLEAVTTDAKPILLLTIGKGKAAETQRIKVSEFIDVMGWKAVGNKLVDKKAVEMEWENVEEAAGKQGELFR